MQLAVYVKAEYYHYQPAHDAALQVNVVAIENGWDVPNTNEIEDFTDKIWNEIRKQPKEIWDMFIVCEE